MDPKYRYEVTPQTSYPEEIRFGTITASSRWYGATEEEQDWSAWIDNNPPVLKKHTCSDKHDWADTGMAKTWCKKCDLSGRWVLGNVEIQYDEPK